MHLPTPPQVRDGRPGDVEAMSWAASESQRDEWRRQLSRATLGDVDFLVVETDHAVVGKAVVDWSCRPDGSPWLCMVSVDPAFRGQGLGSALLVEAEQRARRRGHSSVEMCVDRDNRRARALYERNGYSVVGVHLDSYVDTMPDGSRIQVETPGWLLRKWL